MTIFKSKSFAAPHHVASCDMIACMEQGGGIAAALDKMTNGGILPIFMFADFGTVLANFVITDGLRHYAPV